MPDRAPRPDLPQPASDPSLSNANAGSVPNQRSVQQQGTYFLGRYRVVDEIGIGGMASVHLGRMDGPGGFQKWVAIKRIHSHLVEDDTFIQMFLDEARVAARISHPNVATVFELGKHEDTYWIAMEYLHGEPLREVMRRCEETGQAMPPEIACRIIADAAEGLHAAHELLGKNGEKLGLVHRDVTPHNLFVTYDGTTKVVDFGIAKFSSRMSSTRAGTLKGKLAYMSPEQVHGEGIDRRTDIFALGVVLWELTTGQRLFRMDNDLDTLAKVQECNVPRPSTIVKGYPIDLEKIVMKALAKNRGERFKSARELSRALQSLLMRRGLFVASDEVAQYMVSIFSDRIQKREAHLRWAAEVTQTINLDGMLAPPGIGADGTFNSEVQAAQSAGARPAPPRPAAGMPPPPAPAMGPPIPAVPPPTQSTTAQPPQVPRPFTAQQPASAQSLPSSPNMHASVPGQPAAPSVPSVPSAPITIPRPVSKPAPGETARPPASLRGISASKVVIPPSARAPAVEEDVHPADADGPTLLDPSAGGIGPGSTSDPPTMQASPQAIAAAQPVAGDEFDDDQDSTIVQPTRVDGPASALASTLAFPDAPPPAAGRTAGLDAPPPVPQPPRPGAVRAQTAPMPQGMGMQGGRAPDFHIPADSPMDLEPPLPVHQSSQYSYGGDAGAQGGSPAAQSPLADLFPPMPPPNAEPQPIRPALAPTVPRQGVPQRDIRTELRTVQRRPPMWMVALVSGSIALLIAGIVIALLSRSPAPPPPRASTTATGAATGTQTGPTAVTPLSGQGPFSAARTAFSAAIAAPPPPVPTTQVTPPAPTATAAADASAASPAATTATATPTATATAAPAATTTTAATTTATAMATPTATATAAIAVPTITPTAAAVAAATSTASAKRTPAAPSTTSDAPSGGGATGQLTVVCIPACDQVLDNGKPMGGSPIYARPVPVGSHRLTLVSGSVKKVVNVVVVADEVKVVREPMAR